MNIIVFRRSRYNLEKLGKLNNFVFLIDLRGYCSREIRGCCEIGIILEIKLLLEKKN